MVHIGASAPSSTNYTLWVDTDEDIVLSFPVTSVNSKTGAVSLTYADVGAPSINGSGASGTWDINISGNASTAD